MFAANVAVNAPLFLPGEHKYRDSIEGGYASMAKFLSEHPNPFGWNPLQYKGLPTHDWYLPALPYTAAAAIRALPFLKPEHVYRLVIVTATCFGPVTMFLFSLEFVRSRRWALLPALLYMLFSAGYWLFPAIKSDQGFTYVPWRVQVLVKYGEGPHNVGLTMIPLVLIACWRAALGRRVRDFVLAAAGLALVTLTNWVAAVALAWCVLMMLAAGHVSAPQTGFLVRRVLIAAGIAYGLAAFWLTPGYIATTFFNWPADAFGFKAGLLQRWLFLGLFAAPALIFAVARARWPRYYFLAYLLACLAGFAWVVAFHYRELIDVIPESRRYAIEFEFFLAAAVGELFRIAVAERRPVLRDLLFVGVGLVLPYFYLQPGAYLGRTWIMLRPAPRTGYVEYQVAARLAALEPRGRVFVFGGTRFRLNSWFALPQVGGTFESGLQNRGALSLAYHIQKGPERPIEERGTDALNMLRAAGVEYAAFHGPKSREHWRDVIDPHLVASRLEEVWRDGEDAIYRVPFTSLANFITPAELPEGRPVGKLAGHMASYIAALDAPDRPIIAVAWEGNSRLVLRAPSVPTGQLITLRVSHDGGWRAEQDGLAVPVRADGMGNVLIEPRPSRGPSEIRLRYGPPWQQILGTLASFLTAALCWRAVRRERAARLGV